jgi:hypothetical protein
LGNINPAAQDQPGSQAFLKKTCVAKAQLGALENSHVRQLVNPIRGIKQVLPERAYLSLLEPVIDRDWLDSGSVRKANALAHDIGSLAASMGGCTAPPLPQLHGIYAGSWGSIFLIAPAILQKNMNSKPLICSAKVRHFSSRARWIATVGHDRVNLHDAIFWLHGFSLTFDASLQTFQDRALCTSCVCHRIRPQTTG